MLTIFEIEFECRFSAFLPSFYHDIQWWVVHSDSSKTIFIQKTESWSWTYHQDWIPADPIRAHRWPNVFILQTMLNTMGEEVKVLNHRGQLLKASVLTSLSDESIYKNHFFMNQKLSRTKDEVKVCIIIIHRFRGVPSVKTFKSNPNVMEFLCTNKVTF